MTDSGSHTHESAASSGIDLPAMDFAAPLEGVAEDLFKSERVAFDFERFEQRQGVVSDIVERHGGSKDATEMVRALNEKFKEWDDDFGISYLYISGVDFSSSSEPLEFHGKAQFLAFSGNDAPNCDFENADLTGAVWVGTYAPGSNFREATLSHALFNFCDLSGSDFTRATAYDIGLNFARIDAIKSRGATFAGAYMMFTRGLVAKTLLEGGDFSSARTHVTDLIDGTGVASEDSAGIMAARFNTGNQTEDVKLRQIVRQLRAAKVFNGDEYIGQLVSGQRLPGRLLNNVNLRDARLTGSEFEAGVWNKVHAPGVGLRNARIAGLTIASSKLDDADTEGLWAPAVAVFNTSVKNIEFDNNIAGGLFANCDMTGVQFNERASLGGALVVGGRPPRGLDPEVASMVRVLEVGQMPPKAMELVAGASRWFAVQANQSAELSSGASDLSGTTNELQ